MSKVSFVLRYESCSAKRNQEPTGSREPNYAMKIASSV